MKEQFRIGKLAQQLGVKRFVIRFWEKEFGIHPQRTPGGQRYYLQQDFDQFKLIKELLYQKGFTIAGAKRILHQEEKMTSFVETSKTTLLKEADYLPNNSELEEIASQIQTLQKQLIKLRELL